MKCRLSFLLIILASTLLPACARAPLAPWRRPPTVVQFSARILPQAADLPLQGGFQMTPQNGRLGLIAQFGRTLGQCTFTPEETSGVPGMALHCEAAPGMNLSAEKLVRRTAQAVYRALCTPPPARGQGWTVREAPQNPLHDVVYADRLGEVHIQFTQGRP